MLYQCVYIYLMQMICFNICVILVNYIIYLCHWRLITSWFVIIIIRPPLNKQIQFDGEGKNTYKIISKSKISRKTVCYQFRDIRIQDNSINYHFTSETFVFKTIQIIFQFKSIGYQFNWILGTFVSRQFIFWLHWDQE